MEWSAKDQGWKVPVKCWAKNLEPSALQQAVNAANLPCAFHHVAVMPDGHTGMGFPIGGVMALKNAICPNAVGVDISCGMRTVETSLPAEAISDMRIRRFWLNRAKALIPVGEGNAHRDEQEWEDFLWGSSRTEILPIDRRNLGTLGGGNHFASLEKGDDGMVHLLLHSGSRNLGYRICNKYHKIALMLCKQWYVDLPDEHLAFLPIYDENGQGYIAAMDFAIRYAVENRRRMMEMMEAALVETLNEFNLGKVEFGTPLDINHNYATLENHFGEDVWVHRKGATSAKKGQLGIIPGSMGTASYIVRGLGNPDSFMSCSHGAGRAMSRTAANERLTEEECNKAMEGIVFDRWHRQKSRRRNAEEEENQPKHGDLSEAPMAYKDIEEVIANERDLVEPVLRMMPLAVLKG